MGEEGAEVLVPTEDKEDHVEDAEEEETYVEAGDLGVAFLVAIQVDIPVGHFEVHRAHSEVELKQGYGSHYLSFVASFGSPDPEGNFEQFSHSYLN
jgi:hypothetical protein